MPTIEIRKSTVDDTKPAERDLFYWDRSLRGFGLKVTPRGRKVYLIQYRAGGGRNGATRKVFIGEHGTLTADQARTAAKKLLASVRLGNDPAAERARRRNEICIADLCDRYIAEHVAFHNRSSTAHEVRRLVETRIKPALGSIRISELTRADIKAWHAKAAPTPYSANRGLAALSKMMALAVNEWELRRDNPCKGIKRFPETKRERFYDDGELQRIGEALANMERDNAILPGCALAIRLLALTGMRVGEVLRLRWSEIDAERSAVRMSVSKTGAKTLAIGASVLALLQTIERTSEWVVVGADRSNALSQDTLNHSWRRVRTLAGIFDGRLHDFRHTAGTYGAHTGANAFLVRDLLGHKTIAMTCRYVERSADPVRSLADKVSSRVSAAMTHETTGIIHHLDRKRL